MNAEIPHFRDLTPQEEQERIMGIFERNIHTDIVIGEEISKFNQPETNTLPQDFIDGINLARRLTRNTIHQSHLAIRQEGTKTMNVHANVDMALNRHYSESAPVTVFDAKELGKDLGKFVQEYQSGEYEATYINPPNHQHGFPSD